jgi:hypothetical protein
MLASVVSLKLALSRGRQQRRSTAREGANICAIVNWLEPAADADIRALAVPYFGPLLRRD